MGKKDPRVDAYVAQATPFARPILKRLRKVVHAACPAVEETMKWQMPHFEFKGPMCRMAGFKEHCAFGFWKGELVFTGDPAKTAEAMGNFGRLTSMEDLPGEKELVALVRKAAELNERGIRPPRDFRPSKPRPAVPEDLRAALAKNKKAQRTFQNLSPSHQREYVEWITGAKREETRQRRLQTALEWMAEGKTQNWRYS